MKRSLLLMAGLLAAGCGRADRSPAASLVRDSAGIRIAENRAPVWRPGEGWRLSLQPLVDIGGASAGEEYELYQAWSASRLSDGRIVVANGGSYKLRFYAADGTFLQSVGRQGDGPGEFRNLHWMRRMRNDSLITYDLQQLRFAVFDSSGAFARGFRLQATADVPWASVVDRFAHGSILAQGFAETGDTPPRGLQRYRAPLYHFAADGMFLADLGMFSGNEGYYEAFHGAGFSYHEAFFPLWTYRRGAGNRLLIAANDTYELRRYTQDGELVDIIRRVHRSVPVTQAHIQQERRRRLEAASSDEARQTLSGVLDRMPMPETFPAYHLVLVDGGLNIWVQEYPIPGDERATWSVFDSTGVWLGQLDTRLGFEPYEIGADYVLGRRRDADEVEHVQVYELIKGGDDVERVPLTGLTRRER